MDTIDDEPNFLNNNDWFNKLNPLKGTALAAAIEANNKIRSMDNSITAADLARASRITKTFVDSQRSGGIQLATEAIRKMNENFAPIKSFHDVLRETRIPPINAISEIGRLQRGLQKTTLAFQLEEKKAWSLAFGNSYLGFKSYNAVYESLKLYKSIEDEALSEEQQKQKEEIGIIRLDDTIRVQKLIRSVYDDNEELFRVHPFDFEEMIAELLRKRNFLVELTKKTRDGGKDIIALHDLNGLGQNKYLIECKRHGKDNPVGVKIIREFCFTVLNERVNKGILFTSSYFSPEAKQLRDEYQHILNLKDGGEVIDWVKEYIASQK